MKKEIDRGAADSGKAQASAMECKDELKYDVIVIAGTTESRQVIEKLLSGQEKGARRPRILASVATELGREMLTEYAVDVHVGRLDREGFLAFFKENPCGKIIDASHPFAKIVTETVRAAAEELQIPYERYERAALCYDYEKIIYVKTAEEAVAVLNTMEGNVLLTTGVNTAALYMDGVRDGKKRLYIRVLDNENSLLGCEKAGYPAGHVFGKMPPYTVEDNLAMLRETGARVLVSKDSGKTGGVDVKVEACRRADIPMILIARPPERK